MQYVIDLSGAKEKSESESIRSLEEKVTSEDALTYLLTMRQEFIGRSNAKVVRFLDAELTDDSAHAAKILGQVEAAKESGESVVVSSYLSRVGSLISSKYGDDHTVTYEPLARLAHRVPAEIARSDGDSTSALMSSEEIVTHVVAAIGSSSSGGVDQTALRTLLATRDQRFAKDAGPVEWKQQGFIGRIVNLAVSAGLVRAIAGERAPQVNLTLTPAGQRSLATHTDEQPAVLTTMESNTEDKREEGKDPKVQEWWDVLGSHGFGPFQQVRLELYSALRAIVTEESGSLDGINLIKRATHRVRAESGRKLPWQKVQEFLRTLLREELVLRSGEDLVSPRFGINEPKIDDLVDSFDLALDARLLVLLVKIGGIVHHDDTWRIAAALFNSRASEDRADQVFLAALATGEVTIDPIMGQLFLVDDSDTAAWGVLTIGASAPQRLGVPGHDSGDLGD
ncbi:hypothetical protein JF66_07430 [Cryobacterium sp. MLB-32]|nr:hypothetical protein JF66_07430 [Cryobacterium sp. MLB-32]